MEQRTRRQLKVVPAKKPVPTTKPKQVGGKLGQPRLADYDSRWYRQYEKGNPFKGAIRKHLPKSSGQFSPAYQLVVEFNYRCKKARQGSWKSTGYSQVTRSFDEKHLEALIHQAWWVAKWSKPLNYTCGSDELVIIGEPNILGFIYWYRGKPAKGKNSKESAPKLKVFKDYQAELPSESIPVAKGKKQKKAAKPKKTIEVTHKFKRGGIKYEKKQEYVLVTRHEKGKRPYKYWRVKAEPKKMKRK
jgi:hypothetical protein